MRRYRAGEPAGNPGSHCSLARQAVSRRRASRPPKHRGEREARLGGTARGTRARTMRLGFFSNPAVSAHYFEGVQP
jgi:hypothetical protein